MDRRRLSALDDDQGFALMTVMIFTFVLIIAGMAFFAMSSYETNQAMYRQQSSEAFYLADGAIERARARFLQNRKWRVGFPDTTTGNGHYSLTVVDSTYGLYPYIVRLLATGTVGKATRCIEVFASVPPSGFRVPLLVCQEAYLRGKLAVSDTIHVNEPLDGQDANHIEPEGSFTTGWPVYPPMVYTEPSHYPGSSYYVVTGQQLQPPNLGYGAVVRNGFTGAVCCTLSTAENGIDFHWDNARRELTIDMGGVLQDVFNGPLAPEPGTSYAVVNFGGPHPLLDPNANVNLILDGGAGTVLNATIINTRFIGSDRLDTTHWTGGITYVKQVTLEPLRGLGILAHNFQKEGVSNVVAGTEDHPCLIYVTGDVGEQNHLFNSNFVLNGSIVCLGDWYSGGGVTLNYDEDFIANLPDYLRDAWQNDTSGTLVVHRWREVPAS